MNKTIHFVVSGRVQGVFFRQSAKQTADRLGISGWVRNQPDGRVEGEATGSSPALQELQDWLRRGPPHAGVSALDWQEIPPQAFSGFQIR